MNPAGRDACKHDGKMPVNMSCETNVIDDGFVIFRDKKEFVWKVENEYQTF